MDGAEAASLQMSDITCCWDYKRVHCKVGVATSKESFANQSCKCVTFTISQISSLMMIILTRQSRNQF